jgi:hypothetical protein
MKVKTQLRYPLKNIKDSFLKTQIHIFLHFSYDLFWIAFFFIWNEIILFQIWYRHLEYLLFSLMRIRTVKFIQCEPCSLNGPKFPRNSFFEFFHIAIMHLVFVTFIHFMYISILCTLVFNVFVVRILNPKKLFKQSLWILKLLFSWEKKSQFFFLRLGKNPETCSNLICYA